MRTEISLEAVEADRMSSASVQMREKNQNDIQRASVQRVLPLCSTKDRRKLLCRARTLVGFSLGETERGRRRQEKGNVEERTSAKLEATTVPAKKPD